MHAYRLGREVRRPVTRYITALHNAALGTRIDTGRNGENPGEAGADAPEQPAGPAAKFPDS